MSSITSLPEEILLHCFTFLDSSEDLHHLSVTCRLFNSITNSNSLWHDAYLVRWKDVRVDRSKTVDWKKEYQSRSQTWRKWPVLFNDNPTTAVRFLIIEGKLHSTSNLDEIKYPQINAEEMARFLFDEDKEAMKLSKRAISNFITMHEWQSSGILAAYIHCFQMENKSLEAAFRHFIGSIALPPSSQLVNILIRAFSREYYDVNRSNEKVTSVFHSDDAIFTMAYAMLMLNTDLHNPVIKKKMKLETFVELASGSISQSQESTQSVLDYLETVYNSIWEKPFVDARGQEQQTSAPPASRTGLWKALGSFLRSNS